MSETLKIGDRIRLLSMPDDPNPIHVGQIGTVTGIRTYRSGDESWHQIDVSWDDGRTLMLVSPPDRFEIIAGGT